MKTAGKKGNSDHHTETQPDTQGRALSHSTHRRAPSLPQAEAEAERLRGGEGREGAGRLCNGHSSVWEDESGDLLPHDVNVLNTAALHPSKGVGWRSLYPGYFTTT